MLCCTYPECRPGTHVLDRWQMAAGLKRATRWRLWARLAEVRLPTLRREVREGIKARQDW
ncbi:MAG: hypothetical protein L0I76_26700 [Pseudonocardia sp.]|nr:hypothetical protein [Pseudonocardia sp.]